MTISDASKTYHKEYYETHQLFDPQSWLAQAETDLLNLVERQVSSISHPIILDLGCGVGKNAIPLVQKLKQNTPSITCVDILPQAIDHLLKNANNFHVAQAISGVVSPIETFTISLNTYHLILANSVLMFLDSFELVTNVLHAMMRGTKDNGYNYICVSTDTVEIEEGTRAPIISDSELPFTLEGAKKLFRSSYNDWTCHTESAKHYTEQYTKNGKRHTWQTTFLTYIFQKTNSV